MPGPTDSKSAIEVSLKQLAAELQKADPATRSALQAQLSTLRDKLGEVEKSIQESPREEAADKIIKKWMLWSLGAGLVPLPLIDLVGVAVIQGKMLTELGKLYGVGSFSQRAVTTTLTAVIGSFGPGLLITGAVGSLLKSLPLVGTVTGGLALSTVTAAATFVVGRLAVEHFEAGGTPETFNVKKSQDRIQELIKEAMDEISAAKPPAGAPVTPVPVGTPVPAGT
jgi:uncharacterized protein (DUF697 family)/uncharacterized coiled-coil protein SlyX